MCCVCVWGGWLWWLWWWWVGGWMGANDELKTGLRGNDGSPLPTQLLTPQHQTLRRSSAQRSAPRAAPRPPPAQARPEPSQGAGPRLGHGRHRALRSLAGHVQGSLDDLSLVQRQGRLLPVLLRGPTGPQRAGAHGMAWHGMAWKQSSMMQLRKTLKTRENTLGCGSARVRVAWQMRGPGHGMHAAPTGLPCRTAGAAGKRRAGHPREHAGHGGGRGGGRHGAVVALAAAGCRKRGGGAPTAGSACIDTSALSSRRLNSADSSPRIQSSSLPAGAGRRPLAGQLGTAADAAARSGRLPLAAPLEAAGMRVGSNGVSVALPAPLSKPPGGNPALTTSQGGHKLVDYRFLPLLTTAFCTSWDRERAEGAAGCAAQETKK